jgi:Spy/CpxP family protein refolding chaperone
MAIAKRAFTRVLKIGVFATGFILLLFLSDVAAQQGNNQLTESLNREANQPKKPLRKILQELDLKPEQTQKIRAVNRKMYPMLRQAIGKLREATRELDEAIYANEINEVIVMEKLQKVQTAQAEVTRLRIQFELELRKILTPEQLEKFRQLRQQTIKPNSLILPK